MLTQINEQLKELQNVKRLLVADMTISNKDMVQLLDATAMIEEELERLKELELNSKRAIL